jgi:hypothetical protein
MGVGGCQFADQPVGRLGDGLVEAPAQAAVRAHHHQRGMAGCRFGLIERDLACRQHHLQPGIDDSLILAEAAGGGLVMADGGGGQGFHHPHNGLQVLGAGNAVAQVFETGHGPPVPAGSMAASA